MSYLKKTDILILCKVVDNFGDIGFVYRLSRSLSRLRPALNLFLCVSDLSSFKRLAPKIDENAEMQQFKNWTIVKWNANEKTALAFKKNMPEIILECFQCSRPDWLEQILFSKTFQKTVQIINIDYLTAEDWAEEFHLLKSGTRSVNVKKINFFPGFTKKTGGLLLPEPARFKKESMENYFKVLIFSYERDFFPIVQAISDFSKNQKTMIFLASGQSEKPFLEAWEKAGKPFCVKKLPFLPQEEWDSLLFEMDFLFVRGEDSLARACFLGKPFIWHAYKQDDDWQLVKVDALLKKLEAHFPKDETSQFDSLSKIWRWYNGAQNLFEKTNPKDLIKQMLDESANGTLRKPFFDFSETLKANGDLAEKVLLYIDSL